MVLPPSRSWRLHLGLAGGELGDERRYLQARVRLYLKCVSLLLTCFWFFATGLALVGAASDPAANALRLDRVVHFILAVIYLGGWAWTRRGERSANWLHALEGAGTVLLCAVMPVLIGRMPPAVSPELIGLFGVVIMLVLRAAIVPSTLQRTALVGLFAVAPLVIKALRMRAGEGQDLPLEWRAVLQYRTLVWGTISIGATTVVSHVIYGLQTQVREAMEIGQYRLERKLGEGGMGVVYEATHRMLRRPTAIKLLPPDRAGEETIRRFEREVVHSSRLCHPNTVAIYDYGRTPEGMFYYAMELLDGLTLEELVTLDGPQPPERVAHILAMAAGSLGEAHAAGLVHRDVKPANIMICDRGGVPDTVKVLDFGLVKEVAAPADLSLTRRDALIGTPMFLAPEAITAPDTLDGRADLYALGATAYLLLTGTPVFSASTLVEMATHHLMTLPQSPSARLGHPIPEALEKVVMACLEKDRTLRPANAAAVIDAVAAVPTWSRLAARLWWQTRGDELLRARKRASEQATLPR